MIKTYKIKLRVNNKERTKLMAAAGTARWAYNFALAKIEEYYKETGKIIGDRAIRKELTQLKQTNEYNWLYKYSNNITKQAIKDACAAYKRFFKKLANKPKFKAKKKSKPSFYVDPYKIKFKNTKVLIEKIGWLRLFEKDKIPERGKYYNPRVTYDGIDWYLSISFETENIEVDNGKYTEGIGIDLGIKTLATISNGSKYENINKKHKVKKILKRLKRLQRQISRKYEQNKIQHKGGEVRYQKTKNIIKLESKIRKIHIRLKNIRNDYIHKITASLVKTKPEYIVVEDLNISGMMKNKHLSKEIQQSKLYEIIRQLEYKTKKHGIKLIKADRYYPSSKKCHKCGKIKKDLKLSDRIYMCECGYKNDRDLNA
ncbi:putative transposase, partial [Marinitoga hydrogenitolerans DSM 16785]